MARYIDAEPMPKGELWEALSDIEKANVLSYLLKQPSADVQEVRQGRWMPVEYTYFGAKRYECSECRDDEFWKKRFVVHKENYCPNCGAKMDGKG